MPTKRHTPSEVVLQTVIEALQRETPRGDREAVMALLGGPYIATLPLLRELQEFPHRDDAMPPMVTIADRIAALERSRAHTVARMAALRAGARAHPVRPLDPLLSATCAELRAFIRGVVHNPSGHWSPPLRLNGPIAFSILTLIGGRVACDVDGETPDVLKLQLVLLMDQVGVANVRGCSRDGCSQLFVKTYRREFCSERCQKRAYMTAFRQDERKHREQQARAQQRRKRKTLVN